MNVIKRKKKLLVRCHTVCNPPRPRKLKRVKPVRKFKLKGTWTVQAAHDLKVYHGLDVEAELAKILIAEIEAAYTDEMRASDNLVAAQWRALFAERKKVQS